MFATLIIKELVINNEFNLLNLIEKIESINKFGITRLVIAPFYYDEDSKSSITEVNTIVEELNLYLNEKNLDIKIYPANIIRDNFENIRDFENKKIGSVNNANYVLLNAEESSIEELFEILYEFNLREYIPIIFGPEKIKEIIDNKKNIKKLLKEKCLLQLDLGSLNGDYGKKVLKTVKYLKRKNIYSSIGFKDDIELFKNKNIRKQIKKINKKSLFILKRNEKNINLKI